MARSRLWCQAAITAPSWRPLSAHHADYPLTTTPHATTMGFYTLEDVPRPPSVTTYFDAPGPVGLCARARRRQRGRGRYRADGVHHRDRVFYSYLLPHPGRGADVLTFANNYTRDGKCISPYHTLAYGSEPAGLLAAAEGFITTIERPLSRLLDAARRMSSRLPLASRSRDLEPVATNQVTSSVLVLYGVTPYPTSAIPRFSRASLSPTSISSAPAPRGLTNASGFRHHARRHGFQ